MYRPNQKPIQFIFGDLTLRVELVGTIKGGVRPHTYPVWFLISNPALPDSPLRLTDTCTVHLILYPDGDSFCSSDLLGIILNIDLEEIG